LTVRQLKVDLESLHKLIKILSVCTLIDYKNEPISKRAKNKTVIVKYETDYPKTISTLLGPAAHTTPGDFTLSTNQMFSVHTTPEEFENVTINN